MITKLIHKLRNYSSQLDFSEKKTVSHDFSKHDSELSAYQYALDESAIVAITNQKGIIKHVNEKFCKISKFSQLELIGQDHRIINSGYHSKDFIRDIWTTIANGKIWRGEIKNKAKDGSFYWVDTTIVPFFDKTGKPFQYLAIRFDITEKKQGEIKHFELEQEIKTKSKEFYDVLSRINDGFLILDHDFQYKYVNKMISEMTGKTSEELIGKSIWEIFPETVGSATYHAIVDAMREKKFKFNLDYSPEFDLWQENYIYPSESGLSMFIRNVTVQRKSEEQIKKSERIYKTIASNIPGSVICIIDLNYNFILVEGDLAEKLGYKKEVLLNKSILSFSNDKLLTELLPYIKKTFAGTNTVTETESKDFHLMYRFAALKNENHEIEAVMVVGIDITALKNAQFYIQNINVELEKKVQERAHELELVNKELESFSYSVAHDLRTPLRAINGYATILAEDYTEQLDEEGKRILGEVGYNAQKMGTLIDDLLMFSRLGRKELKVSMVNIDQLAHTALEELRPGTTGHEQIIIENLQSAPCDITLLKQVFINLISNALKYSSKKETPIIKVSSELKENRIEFCIKDNGAGFDMLYADKLFGVFQRLHSDQEFDGTGVGLAIVQRIIHRHRGKVWAKSKVNEGASFYFSLPLNKTENE